MIKKIKKLLRIPEKPYPKKGQIWIDKSEKGNPYCDHVYEIYEVKNGWALHGINFPVGGRRGYPQHSIKVSTLQMFYDLLEDSEGEK